MTAAALPFIAAGISAVGVGAQLLTKKPAIPKQLKRPTQNKSAENAAKRDVLSKRRGAAANLLTGSSGAESSTGGKTALGT